MINLLNQHDISYIIDNNLIPLKHLNMFLHKNLNEILKKKEYIYIEEFNARINSVESADSNFRSLYINFSLGGHYSKHSFYNFTPKFQRCIIDKIKEHLLNEIAWDD
jgi:hypothetical protein